MEYDLEEFKIELQNSINKLDELIDMLIHSFENDTTIKFINRIQALLDEFPESGLTCVPDLTTSFDVPLENRVARHNSAVIIKQDRKHIGYVSLLIERLNNKKKLAITGHEKHPIPATDNGVALVDKTIIINFRDIIKQLITTKYISPDSLDNLNKCKILIVETEKLMFRIT